MVLLWTKVQILEGRGEVIFSRSDLSVAMEYPRLTRWRISGYLNFISITRLFINNIHLWLFRFQKKYTHLFWQTDYKAKMIRKQKSDNFLDCISPDHDGSKMKPFEEEKKRWSVTDTDLLCERWINARSLSDVERTRYWPWHSFSLLSNQSHNIKQVRSQTHFALLEREHNPIIHSPATHQFVSLNYSVNIF